MKVKKNCLVRMSMLMRLDSGEEVNHSGPEFPLEFICGRGEVVSGLEKQVMGLEPGARKSFIIQPEDAYGVRDETLVRELPKAGLPTQDALKVGQRFSYRSRRGAELCEIREVRNQSIVADFNHPLAGRSLHCDVEVLDVFEDRGEGAHVRG